MAYTKTKWVNGTTKLNAYNLNHIEDGIEENSNAIDTNTEAISNLQESTNGSISEVKASMEKMAAQLTNNSLDGSVIKDESISESKLVKSSSSTSGKIICFLGDSISTAYNSVPTNDGFNEQHAVYYTSSRVNTYLGGSIDNTWWRMLAKDLNMTIGVNDSWSGSFVGINRKGSANTNESVKSYGASLTRIRNLATAGTPDMIVVYIGTNDVNRSDTRYGVPLGTFDTTKVYKDVDLISDTWSTFADAYKTMVMRLQYFYPETKIVIMTPAWSYTQSGNGFYTPAKLNSYIDLIISIGNYFGCQVIDMRKAGINIGNSDKYLPSAIEYVHPNLEGMKLIESYVLSQISNKSLPFEKKKIVDVTYNISSNCHLEESIFRKKVSVGDPFETFNSLSFSSGYELASIHITMNDSDITSTAFDSKSNLISIANVTGPITITITTQVSNKVRISYDLNNITSSNTDTILEKGEDYTTTLTGTIKEITVTMGGTDITSSAYNSSTQTITIYNVTGDIVIYANSPTYTWYIQMLDKVLATYDYNSTTGGEVATSYVYTNDVAKLCSGKTINVLRLKGTAAGKFSIFKLSAPITTAGSFDAMHITKTLLEQIDLTVDSEPRVYKLSKNYELGDNEVLAFGNNVTASEAGRFAYVTNKPSLPEGVSSFYYHARSGGNVGFQATTQALCIDVGYID